MSLAILWADGFDNYGSATDAETLYSLFSIYEFVAGRTDGKAVRLGGSFLDGVKYQNLTPQTDITAAFAFQPITYYTTTGSNVFIFYDISTGDSLCQLDFSIANLCVVTPGAGSAVQTNIPLIPLNNYSHLQIRVQTGASGSVQVVLNGSTTIASFTGLNITAASGTITTITGFWFACPNTGTAYCADDFLLCSGGFPGDCRLQTDFPIANEAVAFTPLANTNWQEVSETAMDSDTSYNSTSTVGARDTFQFTPLALPTGSSILGVFLRCAAAKTDAGTRTYQTVLTGTGGTSLGTVASLSTSYQYQQDNYTSFLSGLGLLTEAGINGFYLGYQLVS